MVVVTEIHEEKKNEWNAFVHSHKGAAYTHLYEWKKIYEEGYNLKTFYLGFYQSNKLIGILPSVVIKRPFTKPFLVSLPFFSYAGILIDNTIPGSSILEALLKYLKNNSIDGFENRKICNEHVQYSDEVTLKRALPNSADVLWKELNAKVRNQIRKAERSALTVKWGIDQVDELYNIYSHNMLSLGTPVHSRLFLDLICSYLKDQVDILTIRQEGKAISVMLLIKFKKQLSDPIASSLKKYLPLNPNMLLYLKALQYGCERGYEEFDFGRSRLNSGTYNFKLQWAAQPYNLSYDFYSLDKSERKSTVSSYRGSKAKLFSKVWRKIPYFISLWVGPKLRKYIP